AHAAADFLTNAGYDVIVPKQHVCCGRPLYDYGFLGQAKKYLQRTLRQLGSYIENEIPIVFLEPSCASVFRDELKNLLPNDAHATRLARQTLLLSEFIEQENIPLPSLDA